MKLSPIGFCGLLSGAILGLAPAAHACSCARIDTPFVQTVPDAAVVIRGKVLAYQGDQSDVALKRPGSIHWMTVEVQEVLKGQVRSQNLTVWGDNGMICRRYVSEFPLNSEWVFALSPDTWSEKGELAISSCGQYALPVQGNTVKGRITQSANQAESAGLPTLRQLVKTAPQGRRKLPIAPPPAPPKCPTRR